MKTLAPAIPVVEVENEGFFALLGKNVEVHTPNFIFAGKLEGVNDKFIKISNAHTVFDTGAYTNKNYSDAQKRQQDVWYIMLGSIIAFGETGQLK